MVKLELPSSFRPSQKLNLKLEAGKSIKGFISHKSLAEIIVQTRVGELILPISDEKLSKGQRVVVYKNSRGKMFLDTVPGKLKNPGPREVKQDRFKSGRSVIIDVEKTVSREGTATTEKTVRSNEIYSRLINSQNPRQALFGVIVKQISSNPETSIDKPSSNLPLKNEVQRYVVEAKGTQFEIGSAQKLKVGGFFSFILEKTSGRVNINIIPDEKAVPGKLKQFLTEEGLKYAPAYRVAFDKLEHFKEETYFPKAVIEFGELIKNSGILQIEAGSSEQKGLSTENFFLHPKNDPENSATLRGLLKYFFKFSPPETDETSGRSLAQNSSDQKGPFGLDSQRASEVSAGDLMEKKPAPLNKLSMLSEPNQPKNLQNTQNHEVPPAGQKSGLPPDSNPARISEINTATKLYNVPVKEGELLPLVIKSDTPVLRATVHDKVFVEAANLEKLFEGRNSMIDIMYTLSTPHSNLDVDTKPVIPDYPIRPESNYAASVEKLLSLFLNFSRDAEVPNTQAAVWGMAVKFPILTSYLLEQFIPFESQQESQDNKKPGSLLLEISERQLVFKDNIPLPAVNNSRPFSLSDFYSETSRKDLPENLNIDLKLQKFVMEAIQSDITSGDSKTAEHSLSGFTWVDNKWRRIRFQFKKNEPNSIKKSGTVNLDIELETRNLKKVVLQAVLESKGAIIHIQHEKGNIKHLLASEIKVLEKSLSHLEFKVLHWKSTRLHDISSPKSAEERYGLRRARQNTSGGLDIEA